MKRKFILILLIGIGLFPACTKKPKVNPVAEPEPAPVDQERDEVSTKRLAEKIEKEIQSIMKTIYFEYDKAILGADSKERLAEIGQILQTNQNVRLRIEGHCDERGTEDYNLALGEKRAHAVLQYLTHYGTSQSRLEMISYGEEKPIAMDSDESSWSQNRRAEMSSIR